MKVLHLISGGIQAHIKERMELHSGVIDVSPARTQNCFACDGCEWAAVCGRDPLLPGSAERDYSGEDRDAVWAKLLGGEEDAP